MERGAHVARSVVMGGDISKGVSVSVQVLEVTRRLFSGGVVFRGTSRLRRISHTSEQLPGVQSQSGASAGPMMSMQVAWRLVSWW